MRHSGGVTEPIEEQCSTIRITRQTAWADRFRRYKVLIDSRVVGTVSDGAEFMIEVPPGHHTLALKINWAHIEAAFDAVPGTPVDFECQAPEGLGLLLMARWVFAPRTWIRLTRR